MTADEEAEFRDRNRYWIDDWIRFAGPGALADQVRFDREWGALRAHAAARGIRIMGDLPFYVAPDAADVRAHPGLFRTDTVAGVPPDAFTEDGQLWGNPTYDWEAMAADHDRWWIARLARSAALHDSSRIDHFRAFESWWAVPRGAETAREGEWRAGPGARVVEAARRELGPLSLVAEDLGIITPEVHRLMEALGLPGMRVLQFAFPGGWDNTHSVQNHPERCVVYVGTHDNDTAVGWWDSASDAARGEAWHACAAAGIHDEPPHRMLIRLALSSRAGLAIVTAQDLLGLGADARLNTPGHGPRQLVVAARAGGAHLRPRALAARRDRAGGAQPLLRAARGRARRSPEGGMRVPAAMPMAAGCHLSVGPSPRSPRPRPPWPSPGPPPPP